jgi:hypothetical protein
MANLMVTIELLSCNDIPILAQLFEESFDYYIKRNPLFVADYIRDLRTLVGLGFAAVLADNGMVCVYQTYLKSFMAADRGDFMENQGAKTMIAQCTANMVNTAVLCFSILRCPGYYEDFVAALKATIARPPFADRAAALAILAKLAVKPIILRC